MCQITPFELKKFSGKGNVNEGTIKLIITILIVIKNKCCPVARFFERDNRLSFYMKGVSFKQQIEHFTKRLLPMDILS
jgi:hypothetical protein